MPESGSAQRKRGPRAPTDLSALYSSDAERAVLGCCLAQALEVIPDADRSLTRDDFFVPAHQEIFVCLTTLFNANSPVDTIGVHQWLVDKRLDKAVGSPGILAEMLVGFANHLNVNSYIRIVKEKSAMRVLQKACATVLQDIHDMPDSVASVLDRAETAIVEATSFNSNRDGELFSEVVKRASREAIEFSEMGGGLRGHSTGFERLDSITGGWCKDQLVVIGGASGIGKSALALTFQRHLAKNLNVPSGLWTGEMGPEQCANRILSGESHISARVIRDGSLSEEQMRLLSSTADKIENWPMYIDCRPGLDITHLRSLAIRWKRKYAIEAMFIDHAQLVRSKGFETDKTGEVTSVTRRCKEIAKELGITVFLNSQLNCDPTEEPTRANLKNSKSLIEDADIILLLYTESEDESGDFKKQVLKVDKQRDGPDRRKVFLDYFAWRTHYQQRKEQR